MTELKERQAFERLIQKFDPQSRLLRTWKLAGGVSALVTALEIAQPDGQTQKMIVRQHGAADLRSNPHIAADEFKLLQVLKAARLATPTPYFFDQSGEIFPTPCIVVEYVEGQTEFAPTNLDDFIHQLATHLARIHAVDCSELTFLPEKEKHYTQKLQEHPAKLDESIDEGRIRQALQAVWPVPQRNPSGLLHGDFWPGNIVWRDGQLAAIIDWEDAALGDPLADLGSTRLEILWAFGLDAMHNFTDLYKSLTPIDFSNLPYWDLWAALRPAFKISEWAADAIAEKNMRERHHLFVTQAFEKLSNP